MKVNVSQSFFTCGNRAIAGNPLYQPKGFLKLMVSRFSHLYV